MTYNSVRDDGQYEDKVQYMPQKEKEAYLASETKALVGNHTLARTRTLSLESLSESFLEQHVTRIFR